MQTQPGARSRSREGGSERRVSSGLSAPGEMERPVGAGVGWLTEVGARGGRAHEGKHAPGREGRFLGNGPSLARDRRRTCPGRTRLRPSRCLLLPVTSVPP
uniref:uncharacterized protein LOC114678252 n=1 Tax=Macaca mulatta TaxID=9544 RepID=UPI0010A24F0E|nr:uncharacterized protein LOC114678252 [Macaca mulatta]